jgi:hypothetical protein
MATSSPPSPSLGPPPGQKMISRPRRPVWPWVVLMAAAVVVALVAVALQFTSSDSTTLTSTSPTPRPSASASASVPAAETAAPTPSPTPSLGRNLPQCSVSAERLMCLGVAAGSGLPNLYEDSGWDVRREKLLAYLEYQFRGIKHPVLRVDYQARYLLPTCDKHLDLGAFGYLSETIAQYNEGVPQDERISLVPILGYAPGCWNPKLGEACQAELHCLPDLKHVAGYRRLATLLVDHLEGLGLTVFAVEGPNEWNSPDYADPAPDENMTVEAHLMHYLALGVHDANRRIPVWFGGLAMDGVEGVVPPPVFVERYYRAAEKAKFKKPGQPDPAFQAMALHPYGEQGISNVMAVHKIMVRYGDGAKLIVGTEAPADDPAEFFKSWSALPYTGTLLLFQPPEEAENFGIAGFVRDYRALVRTFARAA